MKKLFLLLTAALMMGTMTVRADETVTVSATNSDISQGLDLRVVAKLFAEAKNLEQFETMLNNPDSAFNNLDLNGDCGLSSCGRNRRRQLATHCLTGYFG